MRAYVPVGRSGLAVLAGGSELVGPLRACTVDPAWRAGAPEVDEEEWEYEAQSVAAQAAGALDAGVVLAVDVELPPGVVPDDGWLDLPGPLRPRDVAAILTTDLAWFGVQEIDQLLH